LSEAEPLRQIPSPLAGVVALLNRLLRDEPSASASLMPFAGKTVRVVMPPFSLSVVVTDEGLLAHCATSHAPDVRLELPMSSVASIATGSASLASRILMEGDTEFAEVLGRLSAQVRPDIEEYLSRLIGDVAAVRVVGAFALLARGIVEAHQRVASNVAEYLVHENPQLVHPRAVDEFTAAVRVLRDDLARLEKRIERLGAS
jgi:ubiquinone biosynthesis accessory factor UbiJ